MKLKLQKNIQSIAKSTLLIESEAIKKVSEFIDDDFEQAVTTIFKSPGRLVVTGIGKSAIIAQKIVATLNSTGTSAMFLHAADAIHGDLGMIQQEDVVLCLSKSGNTPEIKVLVPLLRASGSKLIGMVSNLDSYLAKQSDFVINATIDKEACPNNLAPTTSTTVTLALGDALAVCLMELQDFSSNDFAKRHPGGALGKQLYLKVSDIHPHNDFPYVDLEASIEQIIFEISSKRLGATVVLDSKKELAGIITDGDLRRLMGREKNFITFKANQVMSSSPKTIEETAYAMEAFNVMKSNNITQLIVMDNKKPVGFIHLHDLLKEGLI